MGFSLSFCLAARVGGGDSSQGEHISLAVEVLWNFFQHTSVLTLTREVWTSPANSKPSRRSQKPAASRSASGYTYSIFHVPRFSQPWTLLQQICFG